MESKNKMKITEIDRLVAHVAAHQDGPRNDWAWVLVGRGQLFHRKVVERALASGRLVMLSRGRDEYGVLGFQLRTEY
jgi:hypothetical protein